MDSENIAAFLLGTMPYSVWLKATVFTVLFLTMVSGTTYTSLGRWINTFFFMTFLTSVNVALFVERILDPVSGPEVHGVFDWYLLISMNVTPVLLSISGIMVAWSSHKIDTRFKIIIAEDE